MKHRFFGAQTILILRATSFIVLLAIAVLVAGAESETTPRSLAAEASRLPAQEVASAGGDWGHTQGVSIEATEPVTTQQQLYLVHIPLVFSNSDTQRQSFQLTVSADANDIPADGVSKTDIVAMVQGADVVSPTMFSLTLETTRGTFPNGNNTIFITTDTEGRAQTSLTSVKSSRGVEATVTARVTRLDGEEVTDTVDVWFEAVDPEPATVLLRSTPGHIPADEQTSAEIAAVVRDERGAPVANYPVTFNTMLGSFANGTKSLTTRTDSSGMAETSLVSAAWSGKAVQATVTALVETEEGQQLLDTTRVWFDSPETPPLQLDLTTDLERIPMGTSRTATMTVTVSTADDKPVPNHPVSFLTTHGRFSNNRTTLQQTTTISGEAQAQVTIEWSEDELQAVVSAQVVTETVQGEERTVYEEVRIEFAPPAVDALQLDLATDKGRIAANGTSATTLRATVVDANGSPLAGYPVTFQTTHGTFSNGDSSMVRLSDASGEAQATLQSAFSTTPLRATVTAQVTDETGDDVTDEIGVWFTVPSQLFISAVPRRIPASTGSMAAIIATVLDETGTPLSDYAVDFSTTLGSFANERTVARVKSNADGEATADLVAAPVLDTASVTAQVSQGNLSEKVTVQFVPDEQADTEPNNVPIESTLLQQGVYRGSFEEEAEGEDDYYLVYLDAGQAIHIELAGIPSDGDYDLVLYDATLEYIAFSNEYGDLNEYIDYVKQSGELEPHYIRVNMATRAEEEPNTYLLTLTISNVDGSSSTASLQYLDTLPELPSHSEQGAHDPELPPKP